MVRAWHMTDEPTVVSQFDHNYLGDYSLDSLKDVIGVDQYHVNVNNLENDETFNQVKQQMGITFNDKIVISPDVFPNYTEKLKIFFAEHLHADDEIRLILDGSGFFDIRDEKDQWVRIMVSKGDLITLPAGSYHRFTTDDKHFVQAMRLFVGDPVWTPLNRPADDHFSRAAYLKQYLKLQNTNEFSNK